MVFRGPTTSELPSMDMVLSVLSISSFLKRMSGMTCLHRLADKVHQTHLEGEVDPKKCATEIPLQPAAEISKKSSEKS
jgi:hypothetical protein